MEEYKDEINLGDNVVKKLKGIYDPEIPVDIYELGLIYDVMINEDKVKTIEEVKSCEVEITFDPPWSKDLMSEEAKLELGML